MGGHSQGRVLGKVHAGGLEGDSALEGEVEGQVVVTHRELAALTIVLAHLDGHIVVTLEGEPGLLVYLVLVEFIAMSVQEHDLHV